MTAIKNRNSLRKKAKQVSRNDIKLAVSRQAVVVNKAQKEGALRSMLSDIVDMGCLLCDAASRRYPGAPWGTVSAIIASLTYVFVPVDAIPDFIPIIGYTDDAAVVAMCLKLISKDLEAYRRWRARK